jgi:hypothetical protein
VALTLHSQADPIEAADSAAPGRPAVTFAVKVGAPGQVETACSSPVRAVAFALSGPDDQPWGGRSRAVDDPEGNRWELLWVPRPSPPSARSLGHRLNDPGGGLKPRWPRRPEL